MTLPAEEYVVVARLVAAGIASRLSLGYEEVDDLQLAIDTVVRGAFDSASEATITIDTDEKALFVAIAPVAPTVLDRHFHDGAESLQLRGILERLVDGVWTRDDPEPSIVLRVDLPAR
jgi:hypothetical protein